MMVSYWKRVSRILIVEYHKYPDVVSGPGVSYSIACDVHDSYLLSRHHDPRSVLTERQELCRKVLADDHERERKLLELRLLAGDVRWYDIKKFHRERGCTVMDTTSDEKYEKYRQLISSNCRKSE
jgi:hypothetical protein